MGAAAARCGTAGSCASHAPKARPATKTKPHELRDYRQEHHTQRGRSRQDHSRQVCNRRPGTRQSMVSGCPQKQQKDTAFPKTWTPPLHALAYVPLGGGVDATQACRGTTVLAVTKMVRATATRLDVVGTSRPADRAFARERADERATSHVVAFSNQRKLDLGGIVRLPPSGTRRRASASSGILRLLRCLAGSLFQIR